MKVLRGTTEVSLDDDLLIQGDNGVVLPALPDEAFTLIYVDPPFNTGQRRRRDTIKVERDPDAARVGFGGKTYRAQVLRTMGYADTHDDYLAFLAPRLEQARRLLTDDGTLYFHIDYREAHYCKVLLDEIFGPECFLNEIIWAYDYGGKSKRRWPAKHDTILVYVKDPGAYFFDSDGSRSGALHGPGPGRRREGRSGQAARPTAGGTRSSRPTGRRRPATRRRSPRASCAGWCRPPRAPGDWCLDFFAGSGTLGAVCAKLDRRFVLVDESADAVAVAEQRLSALVG